MGESSQRPNSALPMYWGVVLGVTEDWSLVFSSEVPTSFRRCWKSWEGPVGQGGQYSDGVSGVSPHNWAGYREVQCAVSRSRGGSLHVGLSIGRAVCK